MNSQRFFSGPAILLIFLLLIPSVSFSQIKKDKIISFSGTIKTISKDLKIVVVNDVKVLISPDTKILDEKGHTLNINDLKTEIYVVVEGVENPDGILARKVVVKELKAT